MDIEELYSILLSGQSSTKLIQKEKELFTLIPELKKCKGFDQNNEWHIYDIYEHILHVIDNVPANINLRLAALFHDIGKAFTYQEDEYGIGHYYGHWEVSQKIFDAFASKYDIDKNISSIVSNLIYYHDIHIDKLTSEEQDKICKLFGRDGIILLYQFKEADLLSQNKKYHYILDDYDKQKTKILLKFQKDN